MKLAYLIPVLFAALQMLAAPIGAQEDEDKLPGNVGEAFGMFAKEEGEQRAAEGKYTDYETGETTKDIPAAEKKKLEAEVRAVLTRMGQGFVDGSVSAILSCYADDYGYRGNRKSDIEANVSEYLADYDDLEMKIGYFRVSLSKSVKEKGKYFADCSVEWARKTIRKGTSKEERLEKGTPAAVEKMKEDAEFEEAAEALEEFYSSQKHPLDDSHKDPTPVGKEVKRTVKANFRMAKQNDVWKIVEAEFGTTRKTQFLSPEEKLKKFWIFVPVGSVILFIVGLVLIKLKDLSVTAEEITVKEDEGKLSPNYKKELEAEVYAFVDSLSAGKRDEEVEALIKAQQWEDARLLIKERITIAHELHDRNMGALYAKYEKKILEWETRYANFY
ncbi:MAG: hypothetical protein HRF49_02770 [bacterium]